MRLLETHPLVRSALFLAGSLLALLLVAGTVSAQPPAGHDEPLGPDGQFSRRGEAPTTRAPETVDLETAPRVHWIAESGGLWSDPANWRDGRLPTADDVAVLDAPGDYIVELDVDAPVAAVWLGGDSEDASPTLHLPHHSLKILAPSRVSPTAALHLDGGIVTGPGDLTVEGFLRWTGGSMSGSGTTRVTSSGRVEIDGPERKFLSLRNLESSGEMTWSGSGDWVVTFRSAVRNLAGGHMSVDAQALFDVYGPPGPTFDNAGTYRRTGAGRTAYEAPFTNGGTVEIEAGVLELQAGYSQTGGTTRVADGAEIVSPRSFDILAGTVEGEGSHPEVQSGP